MALIDFVHKPSFLIRIIKNYEIQPRKIWLIYKVAMPFWINIYGCHPYPRHGHLSVNQLKNQSYCQGLYDAIDLSAFLQSNLVHRLVFRNCNQSVFCNFFYLTIYLFNFFPPAIMTQEISLMYCDFPLSSVKLQGVLFVGPICQENLKSIESQPTNTQQSKNQASPHAIQLVETEHI